MMVKNESRAFKRERIVAYVYSHEVIGKRLSALTAFESGEFAPNEQKIIDNLVIHYDRLVALITRFLGTGWTFNRLPALERALLIVGAFEMTFNDRGLVINELVNYAKKYIPGDAYKYVNKVLDLIASEYEKVKKNPEAH